MGIWCCYHPGGWCRRCMGLLCWGCGRTQDGWQHLINRWARGRFYGVGRGVPKIALLCDLQATLTFFGNY